MINRNPKRSDEPIWWSLFSAGGVWFAMITPVTALVLGILIPLEIIDVKALEFTRVREFAISVIGFLFIAATLALPMWHAMHRFHHGLHDFQIHAGTAGKVACYGFAALVSLAGIVLLFML